MCFRCFLASFPPSDRIVTRRIDISIRFNSTTARHEHSGLLSGEGGMESSHVPLSGCLNTSLRQEAFIVSKAQCLVCIIHCIDYIYSGENTANFAKHVGVCKDISDKITNWWRPKASKKEYWTVNLDSLIKTAHYHYQSGPLGSIFLYF